VPTGTTTGPSGTLSKLGSAIDFSKVHWYEYQVTVSGTGEEPMTMDLREDFNVDYQGSKANKMSMSMEMKEDGSATSMDYVFYMDTSGNSLGGHYKIMLDGSVLMEADLPAGETSAGSSGLSTSSNPLTTEVDASLTSAGADTVAVGAGTFVCTKYTVSTKDGSGTVWISPTVPIPVKYETKDDGTNFVMELSGWG
jgi:hypothetical protein